MRELLQDFLLVEKEEIKKETDSGFIKAGSVKEKQSVAKIVEVGRDVENISIGDRVLCADHSIREVTIDNEKYNFVRYKDLIAIIS